MPFEKYKVTDMVKALRASKGMIYVAARQLGCSSNTIYAYAKKHESVKEALTSERGLMVDTAELALWKALQAGEGWAVSLALKTVGKDRGYTERVETVNYNVDPALMQKAIALAEKRGISAADLFNSMIAELQDNEVSDGTE